MSQKSDLKAIREYWTDQARSHGPRSSASWTDRRAIELESREILRYLGEGDRVLDVGCANGHATLKFASKKNIEIDGIDYIPEMIEQARLSLGRQARLTKTKIDFRVGDVTALAEPSGAYDKVICVRVIINLDDWERQKKGLSECGRVLKPGGMLLLSEATLQGWNRLNGLRRHWGLTDIPMPSFNRYLDEERVVEALSPELDLVGIRNFASTYYAGTRVLKPLVLRWLRAEKNIANPNTGWNRWFARLPAWGDYGTQKLFIFRKRSA